MIRSSFVMICYLIQIGACFGQLLPLEIINSGGAQQQQDISLQWSIGESLVLFSQEDSVASISEGFHQLFIIDRDLKEEAQVRADLYPNPISDLFTLDVDNPGVLNYALTNPLGQILLEGEFEQKTELDISSFTSGVYFLTIYTDARFEKSFSLLKI